MPPLASDALSLPLDALLERFHVWMQEAGTKGTPDPTAMTVATVDANGDPDARIVLLKHADEKGFVFYTNLGSTKADNLRHRPRAALCFHWASISRQVRIKGATEAVTEAEADAYFATRPRLSQIGAWVSKQSQPMAGVLDLEKGCAAYALQHPIGKISRPPFWSGFRVVPDQIEFWQERPFRRHDRQVYRLIDHRWHEQRLYP